jgi:FkbM family methyltransferase
VGKKRGPLRRGLRVIADYLVPPALMKYQIAHRNYRRGEPEIRLLHELVDPTRAAVDIGAYLGAYTFFLNRLATAVHAFEPQQHCVRFLQRAFSQSVQVYPYALADASGLGSMVGATNTNQAARLSSGGEVAVEVRTLDEFGLDNIGFIKIDAEGSEAAIIRGGQATIDRCRPTLLVEIEERHLDVSVDSVMEQIIALGYQGCFLHDSRLRPLREFSVQGMQRARLGGDRTKPYINNFIFRPIEHARTGSSSV